MQTGVFFAPEKGLFIQKPRMFIYIVYLALQSAHIYSRAERDRRDTRFHSFCWYTRGRIPVYVRCGNSIVA